MLDNKDHLDLCINWLLKAQSQNNDNGVSAIYESDTKFWRKSYPETTGYIIPTFLSYSKLFNVEKISNSAYLMGEWEIDIQSPDGGAGDYVGFYLSNTLKPRLFNTGQVILGLIDLYKRFNNENFLISANKSAIYILRHVNEEGFWDFSNFNTPKTYNVRVAWAILELYNITNEKKYKIAGESIVNWTLSQKLDNGFINKNHFSEYNLNGLTHLIGYTLVGLLKVYFLKNYNLNYDLILDTLNAAAKNITEFYLSKSAKQKKSYIGLPSYFDQNWNAASEWACITGNIQIEYFLRLMSTIENNTDYLNVANNLLDEIKKFQIVGNELNDENLIGGLFGSDPIDQKYCPYQIPNWGVKFFADSLIQKISKDQDLIG
jgi:hypothetical protein